MRRRGGGARDGHCDPRYGELAREIAAKMPAWLQHDPVAEAMSVVLWLGREGTYSLRSGHAHAEDPTADFLFGDRTGYCVHFAHAAVYLMRSLGVPARVGAGYAVEEAARHGAGTSTMAPIAPPPQPTSVRRVTLPLYQNSSSFAQGSSFHFSVIATPPTGVRT